MECGEGREIGFPFVTDHKSAVVDQQGSAQADDQEAHEDHKGIIAPLDGAKSPKLSYGKRIEIES